MQGKKKRFVLFKSELEGDKSKSTPRTSVQNQNQK